MKNYPDLEKGAQAVHQLPWSHIIVLIHRVKTEQERAWYIEQVLANNWSRYTLEDAIKTNLYQRQAISELKTSNYLSRLPSPQSELAHNILKNPYNFSFLGLHDDAHERAIEHASIQHITKFLLELGKGVRHEVASKSCFHSVGNHPCHWMNLGV